MDLEPSDEQAALRDELARFLGDRVTPEARRAAAERPGAVDRDLWRELGGLGVFSLTLPEAAGGVGLGWADAVLVVEELGRAAVPGPVVGTVLAAALLGDAVPGAATGEAVVGAVDAATPALVEHRAGLDHLVVLDAHGVRLVDPTAVAGTPLARPLDPLTPVDRVARLDVPGAAVVGDRADARTWRRVGGLLTAALHVGLGEGAVRVATAYAGERRQFDRIIGSFQALKHLLADAYCGVEMARSAVWSAAVLLDEAGDGTSADPDPASVAEVDRSVAAARIVASEAAARSTKTCVQVHGGMGYTWELDAHLYLKRALVLDTAFGSAEAAVETMAAAL